MSKLRAAAFLLVLQFSLAFTQDADTEAPEAVWLSSAGSCVVNYTVQSGDTLTEIARNFNTTPERIQDANPDEIRNRDSIAIGLKLEIPTPCNPEGETPVRPGPSTDDSRNSSSTAASDAGGVATRPVDSDTVGDGGGSGNSTAVAAAASAVAAAVALISVTILIIYLRRRRRRPQPEEEYVGGDPSAPWGGPSESQALINVAVVDESTPRPPTGAKDSRNFHCGLTQEDVRMFLRKAKASGSGEMLAASPSRKGIASQKLTDLCEGTAFAENYMIEAGGFRSGSTKVLFARHKINKRNVAIKFFMDEGEFKRELSVHKEMNLGSAYIAGPEDSVLSSKSGGYPNALVFKKGDYTLKEWVDKKQPTDIQIKDVLHQILKGLEHIHAHRVVHRDLKPSNIMFFAEDHSWKLIDMDNWARRGDPAPVAYTLGYASPEVMAAVVRGDDTVAVETSADMWAFGVIAYELASGSRFFGAQTSNVQILQRILGLEEMPQFGVIRDRTLQRLINNCVKHDPQLRWSASRALGNAYFQSADDTVAKQEAIGKMVERLERIQEVVQTAADEIRFSNLVLGVQLERVEQEQAAAWPTNDELAIISERLSPMETDGRLPDHPIFLLNLEHDYKVHVTIAPATGLPLRIASLDYVSMTPHDGTPARCEALATSAPSEASRGTFQAALLWRPASHANESLSTITPSGGPLDDRVVKVWLEVGLSLEGSEGTKPLRGPVYVKMHDARKRFAVEKAFRRAGKMWDEAPKWVKDCAKGAVFTFKVISAAKGVIT